MPNPSDADRQRVVDRLRSELLADRLALDEFEARAGAAYAAGTLDELADLSRGLPAVPAARSTTVDPARPMWDLAAREGWFDGCNAVGAYLPGAGAQITRAVGNVVVIVEWSIYQEPPEALRRSEAVAVAGMAKIDTLTQPLSG